MRAPGSVALSVFQSRQLSTSHDTPPISHQSKSRSRKERCTHRLSRRDSRELHFNRAGNHVKGGVDDFKASTNTSAFINTRGREHAIDLSPIEIEQEMIRLDRELTMYTAASSPKAPHANSVMEAGYSSVSSLLRSPSKNNYKSSTFSTAERSTRTELEVALADPSQAALMAHSEQHGMSSDVCNNKLDLTAMPIVPNHLDDNHTRFTSFKSTQINTSPNTTYSLLQSQHPGSASSTTRPWLSRIKRR